MEDEGETGGYEVEDEEHFWHGEGDKIYTNSIIC